MKHLPQKRVIKTLITSASHPLESQCNELTFRERGPARLPSGKQTGYLGNLLENSLITGGRWFMLLGETWFTVQQKFELTIICCFCVLRKDLHFCLWRIYTMEDRLSEEGRMETSWSPYPSCSEFPVSPKPPWCRKYKHRVTLFNIQDQALVPGESSWILYYRVWQWPGTSCGFTLTSISLSQCPGMKKASYATGVGSNTLLAQGWSLWEVLFFFLDWRVLCHECECYLCHCLLKEAAVIIYK